MVMAVVGVPVVVVVVVVVMVMAVVVVVVTMLMVGMSSRHPPIGHLPADRIPAPCGFPAAVG